MAQSAQLEKFLVRDVATFKALADPTRLQILLDLTVDPKAVKEVAATLQVRPTRLYYHFKILEQAGLIRVADRRLVSGIEESRYEVTAHNWEPAPEATPSLVKAGIIRAMLAMVRTELEFALLATNVVPLGDPGSAVAVLTMTELAMSESEVQEVQNRLEGLLREFSQDGPKKPGQRSYRALLAAYLPPSELRDSPGRPGKTPPKRRRTAKTKGTSHAS